MPSKPTRDLAQKLDQAQNPIQSVEKALRILNAFSQERPEWGIRELGRELDINPTSTFRLIKTLQEAGYIEREVPTRRYRLGPKVVELAALYAHTNPLPSVALKIFESLTGRFPYNFYLGALRGSQLIYLARVEGHGPIKVTAEPGDRISLHSSAAGKVMLAFQDDAFLSTYLARPRLKAQTPRTITKPAVLRRQLCEIREQGWAFNDGEHYNDIAAVAVPVRDRRGQVVASVSLAFPRYLLREGRFQVPGLVTLASEISAEITARI